MTRPRRRLSIAAALIAPAIGLFEVFNTRFMADDCMLLLAW